MLGGIKIGSRVGVYGTARPILARRTFLGGWLKAWQTQTMVYPPKPSEFTTKNRIFEAWISNSSELHDYLLFKEPLLLNFTYADQKCNKISQSLFDVLSKREKYPSDSAAVNLVNIMADTQGGRELMHEYTVGKIPTIVLLKKQIPVERLALDPDTFEEEDLVRWLRNIR